MKFSVGYLWYQVSAKASWGLCRTGWNLVRMRLLFISPLTPHNCSVSGANRVKVAYRTRLTSAFFLPRRAFFSAFTQFDGPSSTMCPRVLSTYTRCNFSVDSNGEGFQKLIYTIKTHNKTTRPGVPRQYRLNLPVSYWLVLQGESLGCHCRIGCSCLTSKSVPLRSGLSGGMVYNLNHLCSFSWLKS